MWCVDDFPVFVQHDGRFAALVQVICPAVLVHLGELTLRIGNLTAPPTIQITRGVQLHLLGDVDLSASGPNPPV